MILCMFYPEAPLPAWSADLNWGLDWGWGGRLTGYPLPSSTACTPGTPCLCHQIYTVLIYIPQALGITQYPVLGHQITMIRIAIALHWCKCNICFVRRIIKKKACWVVTSTACKYVYKYIQIQIFREVEILISVLHSSTTLSKIKGGIQNILHLIKK